MFFVYEYVVYVGELVFYGFVVVVYVVSLVGVVVWSIVGMYLF